jgi:hypothetical protein
VQSKVFEIRVARNGSSAGQRSQFDLVRDLPDVPVLSETLLLMELMVRERTVCLREISQLVLSDLGAALQILRMAGREDSAIEALPTRIEDCISGLGLQACLEAMSQRTIRRSSRHPEIVEAWMHARAVAENCRILAPETSLSINPEDAYLVGLFHAIGALPPVLGWARTTHITGDPDVVGLRMAQAWSLPRCVSEYFAPLRPISGANRWREIVQRAHEEANAAHAECPLNEQLALHAPVAALAHG